MARFLLIIRTPLQARIAQIALTAEGEPTYDLLFFTQQKTAKNMQSFASLGKKAERKFLSFVPIGFRWFLSELLFYALGRIMLSIWGRGYDTVVFGSLDSPALAGLATQFRSRLVTVDDGSANILSRTSYFREQFGMRFATLRWVTRSPELRDIREVVELHYTIFPGYENVIETKKLAPVLDWPPKRKVHPDASLVVILVSTAERLWMSASEFRIFETYLATVNVDYKIPHPMDETRSFDWIPELPHQELLAEEALAAIGPDFSIHLVGSPSTVMFTASELSAKRTVLITARLKHLRPSFEGAGCEIIILD